MKYMSLMSVLLVLVHDSTSTDLNFSTRHNLIDMSCIKLIGPIIGLRCCLAINIVIEKVPKTTQVPHTHY